MEVWLHDDRWLEMDGDGNLSVRSKMVSGVRCECPAVGQPLTPG